MHPLTLVLALAKPVPAAAQPHARTLSVARAVIIPACAVALRPPERPCECACAEATGCAPVSVRSACSCARTACSRPAHSARMCAPASLAHAATVHVSNVARAPMSRPCVGCVGDRRPASTDATLAPAASCSFVSIRTCSMYHPREQSCCHHEEEHDSCSCSCHSAGGGWREDDGKCVKRTCRGGHCETQQKSCCPA